MKNKVIVITGPTAVGKSKISLKIAKHFKTELINGDAYEVYRGMNIGIAKSSENEQKQIKHHLLDILDPKETFSVSDYQKLVRSIIDQMHRESLLPIIVGGSGLYIDSVIRNYQFNAPKRSEDLMYENLSNEELHKILEELDYDASLKIHANNRKRVLRAIELAKTNDFSSRTLRNEFVYDALVIFLNDDREKLYNRINLRVDQMFEDGLLEEVKKLYPDGLSLTSKGAIGYKELFEYFDGTISLEEAKNKIKQNSRHYAKRQLTWYRNQDHTTIVYINPDDLNETVSLLVNLINEFLKS